MNIILSSELENTYTSFKVVRTVKEVSNLFKQGDQEIDVLILHKVVLDSFKLGVFITDLYEAHKELIFLYICDEIDRTLETMISGLGGVILNDSSYLDDEDDLLYLLEETRDPESNHSLAIVSESANIVENFVEAVKHKESRINAPVYLKQVQEAINTIVRETDCTTVQLIEMSSDVQEVFKQASKTITELQGNNSKMLDMVKELKENEARRPQQSNKIEFFQTIRYDGFNPVLVIKELSPCRYLTWMLLTYVRFLSSEASRHKKVKFIIAHQRGYGVQRRYSDSGFTTITEENKGSAELYNSALIATNNPKRGEIKKMIGGEDVIIILDRMYGQSPIVQGSNVHMLYGVGGLSAVKKFDVSASKCIFSITEQDQGYGFLPHIVNFSNIEESRLASCMSVYRKDTRLFEKLDKLLKL